MAGSAGAPMRQRLAAIDELLGRGEGEELLMRLAAEDEEAEVRAAALKGITLLQPAGWEQAQLSALQLDPVAGNRRLALEVVARFPFETASRAVADVALNDGEATLRRRAWELVARHWLWGPDATLAAAARAERDPEVAQALIALLLEKAPIPASREALQVVARHAGIGAARRDAMVRLLADQHAAHVDTFADGTLDPDAGVARAALRGLLSHRAYDRLGAVVKNAKQAFLHEYVLDGLAEDVAAEARSLRRRLARNSPEEEVRRRAMESIAAAPRPEDRGCLLDALGDREPDVRTLAVVGLVDLRDPSTADALRKAADAEREGAIREAMLGAAALLVGQPALPGNGGG